MTALGGFQTGNHSSVRATGQHGNTNFRIVQATSNNWYSTSNYILCDIQKNDYNTCVYWAQKLKLESYLKINKTKWHLFERNIVQVRLKENISQ